MDISKYFALLPLLSLSAAHAQDAAPTPTDAAPTESTTDEPEREVAIVITPTRTGRTLNETSSAVTIIDRAQIEAKKSFDIVDALRLAPSVSLAQSGTRGKVTSIFLRGSNSNHTLVLIDGVRANSPADGRFDFGAVAVENIERIEVLRGPQGALYGSDAMGGVVNIITRRGEGPLKIGGGTEFGSFSTNRQVVSARGRSGQTGLSFSASRLNSDGNFVNDDYRNLAASLRLDRNLRPGSQLSFIGRIDSAEVGTPGQRFLSFDPNARSRPRDLFGTVQYTNEARRNGQVSRRDRISLGVFDRRLRFDDAANPGAQFPTVVNSLLRDRVLSFDVQSTLERGRHALTFGGELRRETAAGDTRASYGNTLFDRGTSTRALWVQDEYRSGKFSLVPGLRFEDNSQFGSDLNGRIAAAFDLNARSRLKASAATGFRAPSINELYFPQFGDPNLKPEESTGFEIGFERQLKRGGRLELTAFTTRFRDLIGTVVVPVSPQYPFGSKSGNTDRARTTGLEIGFDQDLGGGLRAVLNHAFLNTSSSQGQLLRRPKFVSSADLLFRRDRFNVDLGLVAQGRRFDNDFAAPPFGNGRGAGFYGGYTRFDLTVGYEIRPGVELYTRAQNLLNKRYEEAAGFPAPRFNFVVGLQTRAF